MHGLENVQVPGPFKLDPPDLPRSQRDRTQSWLKTGDSDGQLQQLKATGRTLCILMTTTCFYHNYCSCPCKAQTALKGFVVQLLDNKSQTTSYNTWTC